MRYQLLLALCLLTAACGSEADREPTGRRSEQATVIEPALTPLELTAKAALEKRAEELGALQKLEDRIRPAMEVYLFDPFSAEYRDLREGRNGAVCGLVNAKNRAGAYVGFKNFVVGRDGKTLYVSRYSDGVDSELYGSFADAYLNACASSEEKRRHTTATSYDDYEYPDEEDSYEPYEAAPVDRPAELEDPFEGI
jgi:hypothetical protein